MEVYVDAYELLRTDTSMSTGQIPFSTICHYADRFQIRGYELSRLVTIISLVHNDLEQMYAEQEEKRKKTAERAADESRGLR